MFDLFLIISFILIETNQSNTSNSDASVTVLPSTISISTDTSAPVPKPYIQKSKNVKYVNKFNLKQQEAIVSTTPLDPGYWECPFFNQTKNLECGCDLKYTLRCSGDIRSLDLIARSLREAKFAVSLLDCTLKNVTILSESRVFENISLHGLVISSGEIKRLHRTIFAGMNSPGLYELGLPNNALTTVPWASLQALSNLDRLDLSNNKIKMLLSSDFSVSMAGASSGFVII